MADKKKVTIAIIAFIILLLAGVGTWIGVSGATSAKAELEAVKASMSKDDLEDYLAKHPGKANSEEIKQLSHDVNFESALADNEIPTYEKFLADYPDSPKAAEIRDSLDWLKTEGDHSSAAYQAFIDSHPASAFVPRAKLRIAQNDFWTRTKPTRDSFLGLLVVSDKASSRFYPQYVDYASKLVANDLIYEAAAILAVIQYHASAGASACLTMAMSALSDSFGDDYYAMERGIYESKVYQAKSDIMSSLDYQEIIDSIGDLALSGDIEVDTKSLLLDQAGSSDVDENAELARKLKYVKVTPFFVMYPDFVAQCVAFLGAQAPTNTGVLTQLSALCIPEAARFICANSEDYAPSLYFNGLGMMARRYRDSLLPDFDSLDERGKAVLAYGFGIADDRRATAKIEEILAGTSDVRLKTACWYALSRFGKDHTPEMNAALGTALADPLGFEVSGDILTAFQWMRDAGLEAKVDRSLLVKALASEDKSVLFFAQAILEDTETPLDAKTVQRVLELSRHEDAQLCERAASLLAASQKSLTEVMKADFAGMTDNQKAMIVSSLTKETYEPVAATVKPFIETALSDSFGGDSTARDQVIGSVGTLGIAEYEDKLLSILESDDSIRSGISLIMLYQDDPEAGKAKLASLDSAAALTTRAFLGDAAGVAGLKELIDGWNIQDTLEGLSYAKFLNDTSFWGSFSKNISYENSNYAPTDYLVAYAAQTAAFDLLVNNRDLRQEVRAKK